MGEVQAMVLISVLMLAIFPPGQMIWEQGSTVVVMLTDVIEAGKVRCCRYWPDVNGTQEYGKYAVTTISEQKERICFTRQLRLKNRMVSVLDV